MYIELIKYLQCNGCLSYCKSFLRHLKFVLNMSKAMVPCLNYRKICASERHLFEADMLTVLFELFGGKGRKKKKNFFNFSSTLFKTITCFFLHVE